MSANLIGYDPQQSGGIFTFGGVGTNLYGVKVGLEKACPHALQEGVGKDIVLFASEASHYSRYIISGWLGIGANNLHSIPIDNHSAMRNDLLQEKLTAALRAGKKVACILTTVGTTDAFGIDNLREIIAIRDRLTAGIFSALQDTYSC